MKRFRSHLMTPGVGGHVALAACTADVTAGATVAVAPCFFQVPVDAPADQLIEIQVTPAGAFRARDGRPHQVEAWRIDAAIAAAVIARFKGRVTPPVVDYEHQTLQAEENGQPAPAAGFIRELEWREGQGLFAKVELTRRAREFIANGEYRYFSPVLKFDTRTGNVVEIQLGALTNFPAIDGMAAIEARAAARSQANETQEVCAMNKHLLAVALALALSTDNQTEEQLEAAALKRIKDLQGTGDLAALRKELGLKDDAGAEEINTAVATLKAAKATGTPDPAKYVEVGVVEQLRNDLAALAAKDLAREIDDLVKPALEDGRLLAAQEKWARELGKSDIAKLKAYLESAPAIAALRGSQTGGQPPAGGTDENGLTADELAVCKATGVDPKDFAAAKTATA